MNRRAHKARCWGRDPQQPEKPKRQPLMAMVLPKELVLVKTKTKAPMIKEQNGLDNDTSKPHFGTEPQQQTTNHGKYIQHGKRQQRFGDWPTQFQVKGVVYAGVHQSPARILNKEDLGIEVNGTIRNEALAAS
jgi:hypothetical protein